MKLYTIYTPSHKILYENYFLKTIPNEFEIVAVEDNRQYCPSGSYYSKGWDKICFRKTELFVRACEENIGGCFFYCDVDVQFFKPFKNDLIDELEDFDIACQDDGNNKKNGHCSGVFICRANEKTLDMFRYMKLKFKKDDQSTLNKYIHVVKHKKLSHRFFNFGHVGQGVWKGQDFVVPDNILIHHANWVVGVDNKMKIMDFVRQQYESKIKAVENV